MKRMTWAAAAAVLAFGVASCGGDEIPTPDEAGQNGSEGESTGGMDEGTDGESTGGMDEGTDGGSTDAVCAGFFDGARPLADRTEDARATLEAGEATDVETYGEIALLKQRIDGVLMQDSEHTELLERVNAPFAEVVSDFQEAEGNLDPEDPEADPYAELGSYDVADSAAAQDELASACQS